MLQASPTQYQQTESRWTLALIQEVVAELKTYGLSGIWRLLQRLAIHYKRGQQRIYSPDPQYLAKAERINRCVEEAYQAPDQVATLFLDELTFYRWASVAPIYAPAGREQPKVTLPAHYNTAGRVLAAMQAVTGKVFYWQRSHITVKVLADFLPRIRRALPDVPTIYIIQDNWHQVHFHPDQVAAAQQENITLIPMPLYAPWLNPIEKLWRKLKQEVLHMHRNGDDWDTLKARVTGFLDRFASGSPELLRYVGLPS